MFFDLAGLFQHSTAMKEKHYMQLGFFIKKDQTSF